MSVESPGTISPEEEKKKEVSRESSDSELVEGGAEFKGDRLEVTLEQLESIASDQKWAEMSEYASNLVEELRPYLVDYEHNLKGLIEGGIIEDTASKELAVEIDGHMKDLSELLYSILREDPPANGEDIANMVENDTFPALKNKGEEVRDAFRRMDGRLGIVRNQSN